MENPRILGTWVTIPPVIFLGRLAQLVERLPYTQNVGSSSLSAPTKFIHPWPFSGISILQFPLPSTLVSITHLYIHH